MREILKKNIKKIFSLNILNIPVGIAIPILIVSYVGVDGYGWYALWWSCMINGLQLVNAFCSGLLIHLSKWSAEGKKTLINLWMTSSSILAFLVALFLVTFLSLTNYFSSVQLPGAWFQFLFLFCSLSIPAILYTHTVNNFHIKLRYELFAKYLSLVCIYILGFYGIREEELFLLSSAAALFCLRYILQHVTESEIDLNFRKKILISSRKRKALALTIRRLFDFGKFSAVTAIANLVGLTGFYFLVANFSDFETLGYFALILIPINISNQLYRAFSMILVPNISRMIKVFDYHSVQKYYKSATILAIFATAFFVLTLDLLTPWFFQTFFDKYLTIVSALIICLFSRLAFLSTSGQQNFLRADNRPEIQAFVNTISIAVLPCALMISNGVGATIIDISLIYAAGNILGAFLFSFISLFILKDKVGGLSIVNFIIWSAHLILISSITYIVMSNSLSA